MAFSLQVTCLTVTRQDNILLFNVGCDCFLEMTYDEARTSAEESSDVIEKSRIKKETEGIKRKLYKG